MLTLQAMEPARQEELHEQSSGWRQALPQHVLSYLPFTLFFPVGVMYAGVLLFYMTLFLSGGYMRKIHRLRQSPMLWPILGLSLVSILIAAMQGVPDEAEKEFWPGLGHYQTYLFLLPFLTVTAGAWQRRATQVFFAGAVMAATLFVANLFHLLPPNTLFRSYVVYQGNKSILLGILLAIAAAWMINDLRLQGNHRLWRIAVIVYVVLALILLAKTRTASLLFILLCGVMLLRQLGRSWRTLVAIAAVVLGLFGGWQYAVNLPPPPTCEVRLVQDNPWNIFKLRSICTVQQIRDSLAGKKVGDDGMRLDIYRLTSEIIADQPWFGHGVASWMPLYRERAAGLSSATMTTPHNDYLLYLTELGVFGLLALLLIWAAQFHAAYRMAAHEHAGIREMAMPLVLLTVAMMVGGMFNAILRDGVFGMAFMILLAIPLASTRSKLNS